jgi:hypothetical protein
MKMKSTEKKASTVISRTTAWFGATLLSLALTYAVATGFPVNLKQEKNAQDKNVEPAKRFVGTWKGKSNPDAILEDVLIFKIEGGQLKGTKRNLLIRVIDGKEPEIVRDEYLPLPDLNVEGKTVTWKREWIKPDHEVLTRATLISDDEILFEMIGMRRTEGQPTLIMPISYKLKREK